MKEMQRVGRKERESVRDSARDRRQFASRPRRCVCPKHIQAHLHFANLHTHTHTHTINTHTLMHGCLLSQLPPFCNHFSMSHTKRTKSARSAQTPHRRTSSPSRLPRAATRVIQHPIVHRFWADEFSARSVRCLQSYSMQCENEEKLVA